MTESYSPSSHSLLQQIQISGGGGGLTHAVDIIGGLIGLLLGRFAALSVGQQARVKQTLKTLHWGREYKEIYRAIVMNVWRPCLLFLLCCISALRYERTIERFCLTDLALHNLPSMGSDDTRMMNTDVNKNPCARVHFVFGVQIHWIAAVFSVTSL